MHNKYHIPRNFSDEFLIGILIELGAKWCYEKIRAHDYMHIWYFFRNIKDCNIFLD